MNSTSEYTDADSHHDRKEIATHFRRFKSRALEVEVSDELKWARRCGALSLISGASPNCSLIERVCQPRHVEANTTALYSLLVAGSFVCVLLSTRLDDYLETWASPAKDVNGTMAQTGVCPGLR